MQIIPTEISAHYDDILKQRRIPPFLWSEYRKRLRFFLDFRSKYPAPSERSDQVRLFSEKLRSQGQTAQRIEQAADAVSLFFASQRDQPAGRLSAAGRISPGAVQKTAGGPRDQRLAVNGAASGKDSGMICEIPGPPVGTVSSSWRGRRYDDWRCLRTSGHPAWDAIIGLLADEIQARHYSRKTLQHYANWTRKFEFYLSHKDPVQLTSRDVKSYLTYLAVQCKVSSSTQNLAFNALLFLFKHVLKRDFGDHKDIPRAKKSTYVPVVLSRDEVQEVFARLHHPHQLIAKLQYGCGLR